MHRFLHKSCNPSLNQGITLYFNIKLILYYLRSKTDITIFNISFKIFLQTWPEVFLVNEFLSFFDSKIIYNGAVILLTDELELDNFGI